MHLYIFSMDDSAKGIEKKLIQSQSLGSDPVPRIGETINISQYSEDKHNVQVVNVQYQYSGDGQVNVFIGPDYDDLFIDKANGKIDNYLK